MYEGPSNYIVNGQRAIYYKVSETVKYHTDRVACFPRHSELVK